MSLWWRIWNKLVLRPRYRKQFGSFGRHVSIRRPRCVVGKERIHVGDRVIVKEGGWLEATPLEPTMLESGECRLSIGEGTSIGYSCHIYAARKVEIGRNVLMGCSVYIADCTHSYEDVSRPIIDQPARIVGEVLIGDGSWIGQHAAIVGVRIGKHCVVGANSVVKADVPDYCVVAGQPARIVKRYDHERGEWISVQSS